MNCFEWQNRASDYLDGSLMGATKTEADEHLDSCRECLDHYKHYRALISSIASQPRSTLPIPIRKSPLAAVLPRLDFATFSRSRWEQVPWYIRTSVEGAGIILMILLGISTGPRLRALYERGMDRNLSEFAQALNFGTQDPSSDTVSASVPLTRAAAPSADTAAEAPSDDFNSGGDEAGNSDDNDSNLHVGNSEVWRFNLKTDSPHEVRPQIVRMLRDLRIPTNAPGLGGVEAPGGIQFDLLVPQSIVPSLKKQLQAIAPKAPAELADSPAGETFTWYMNKSKRELPAHQARIVIWLSQM
ncbi:MAG: zf-HC2 domain-containing protein [Oligoflexia bacterium]|nr:zf-HC2 domain-containing protein [Oligoflexia bacterium]